jgi:hypothetical protein
VFDKHLSKNDARKVVSRKGAIAVIFYLLSVQRKEKTGFRSRLCVFFGLGEKPSWPSRETRQIFFA